MSDSPPPATTMFPHIIPQPAKSSPLKEGPHKKQHQRGPDYKHTPSADNDRKHMLDDALNCTLIRSLSKFSQEFIPHDPKAFAETFPPNIIEEISTKLLAVVKRAEADDDVALETGKQRRRLAAEKEISHQFVWQASLTYSDATLLTSTTARPRREISPVS